MISVFVYYSLASSSAGVLAQQYLPQPLYRPAPAALRHVYVQKVLPRLPNPSMQQTVMNQTVQSQETWTPRSSTSDPVTSAQTASAQVGQPDAELYQPWNLEEFPVRPSELSPYRLVSDTQPVGPTDQRTFPPAGGLQQFLQSNTTQMPTVNLQSAPMRSTGETKQAFPILGIGQDLANEFKATNHRKWDQNHAVLQTAEFSGNMVTIYNVRYSRYHTHKEESDQHDEYLPYTTEYYDAVFNLDDVRTLDLIMVPFQGLTRIAHVESSFGFADGRQVGLSIEARYEEGEKYDPAAAAMRQFELIYLFADERDMIRLATDVNKNDVYIYRLNFEPGEVRTMLIDALQRANKLAANPEFYHPLTNSCVTNLIAHINKGAPSKTIPREYRTLVPGLLDSYLYDLKLVATAAKTFKETKDMAKVNWLVERYGDLEYFSAGIRQNMY